MSRIRILTMLFLPFVIGTAASVTLYRYWVKDYHEQVLKPEMQQRLKAVNSSVELFAFARTRRAMRHVTNATRLLDAFEESDKQKRRNRVHDELNVMHRVNDASKQATLIAAVDLEGKAFVRADDPNWSSKWQKIKPVQIALRGSASHGFVMFEKKPMLFLSIPVVKQGVAKPKPAPAGSDDSLKKAAVKEKPKCSPNRRYACWRPCLRRGKNRKCYRYAKKKKCACIRRRRRRRRRRSRRRRRRKKTGSLKLNRVAKFRLAQGAPDTKAVAAAAAKPKAELGKRSKQLGVIVLGYLLDDRMAQAVRLSPMSEIAFVAEGGNLFGGTLRGRDRERLSALLKRSKGTKKSETDVNIWPVNLNKEKSFVAIRSILPRTTSVSILLLRPMKPIYTLFGSYVLWTGIVGSMGFLFALVLLFTAANRTRSDLEIIEDGILETYNTGNLRVVFNTNSTWLLGALANSLNKLYAQLRGEPDEEYNELKQSGGWDVEGLGVDERILTGKFEVPSEILEEANQAAPQEAKEATPDATAQTNDWIEALLNNPDRHYEDVFHRYVAAKDELGEDTSRLKKERFVQKLYKNAANCMEQFDDCRGVLFDVVVKDNKVILKPQLIPKE